MFSTWTITLGIGPLSSFDEICITTYNRCYFLLLSTGVLRC